MSRQINEGGLALVKIFEGLKLKAYRCPAGVWTIGYGHTNNVRPGMRISEQDAETLLAQDLEDSGEQVDKCVYVPLTDNQFSALSSFVFNAGIGNLMSSSLLRRLNTGNYDCVPSELAKWVKAADPKTGKKITLPGLVKRRAAEGVLWLQTDSEDPFLTSSNMPQRVHAEDPLISYTIIARDGLRLRSGAGAGFDILQLLPKDTEVFVIKEKDGWAAIDLEGDGAIDGWVSQDFLKPRQA